MTTFAITPGATYRISVATPQVAGTPTPSISYAWTFGGVPIGGTRVINYAFDESSLPATLRCVITLANVAGSVSRTLEATIQAAANLPLLNSVTIRDNSSPATIISNIEIGSGGEHIGTVLRVGGPTAADLNPTGSNFTAIEYQWRRGGSLVAGATSQTYTISEADEDKTISVVVTAANTDGSTSRTASVLVGELAEKLPYGDHIGFLGYGTTNVPFANLIHSTIGAVSGNGFAGSWLGRGAAGNGEHLKFTTSDWSDKPEICTADGWLKGSFNGPLSNSNNARVLVAFEWQRLAELLQIPSEYNSYPEQPPTQTRTRPDGTPVFTYPYPIADSLQGRTFKFKLSTYWEGTGYCHWNFAKASNNTPGNERQTPQTVTFAQSPFADGRTNVQMSKVTGDFQWAMENATFLGTIIEESDPADPVRNMLMLISDVREVIDPSDPSTDIPIYAGFDESNYTPFAMLPSAKAKFQRASILRTTQLKYAHANKAHYASNQMAWEPVRDANGDIVQFQGWSSQNTSTIELPIYRSVVSPKKHASGAEFGLEAISRTTHVAFGHSLRAMIEICNQCDCDLWWTHPLASMYIGRQTENGVVYPTRAVLPPDPNDPEQTGYLTVDPDYADWFVSELQYLKPGLKVYSEFVNEVWNSAASFEIPYRNAYAWAQKALADPAFGGDGQPMWYRQQSRTIGASGHFAGTQINQLSGKAGNAISILGACLLAKAFRERSAPCEIVAVAGFQGQVHATGIGALEEVFAMQPYLIKELDAISIAPYRGPHNLYKPPEYPANADRAIIFKEVYGSSEAAWSNQVDVQGAHKGIDDPTSFWRRDAYLPFLQRWKDIALDLDSGRKLPVGWPSARRRWNLQLMAYECGTETQFVSKKWEVPVETQIWAWERTHNFHFDARHRLYARRYWEWLFHPGPKGLTDDPVTAEDQLLYRSGKRPAAIAAELEPMCSPSVHLLTTAELKIGGIPEVYWSNQISTMNTTSPPHQGYEDAKARGVGSPNWWVNYDYGA